MKTASILVDAEGRTALVPDSFAGRKEPPLAVSQKAKTIQKTFALKLHIPEHLTHPKQPSIPEHLTHPE